MEGVIWAAFIPLRVEILQGAVDTTLECAHFVSGYGAGLPSFAFAFWEFRAALTARKGFITPTKFWVFVAVATAVAILPFIHSWAEHGVFWHVFLTILLVIGHVFLSWLTRHLRTIVVVIALGIFSFELGTLVSHNNANLIDYILVIFRPNINNIATIHEFQLDRGHFSSRRLRI
jgi:hypothetical protein